MCNFFSCNSLGDGKPIYFDWKLRKKVLSGELKNYEPDSHTSIADYFGYKGKGEDILNKYEYNPLTKVFNIDQLNNKNDSKEIKNFLNQVDWKIIVEPLIIKPIIHPFKDRNCVEVKSADVVLLKIWASVWESVGASVRELVRASVWELVRTSVWASVWDSVGDSVRASVRASVWDSVGASVGDSVRASVRDSVGASVWDSVGAYFSSFFSIDYKYDFSPCVELWERGIVPSFDGKIWRLHGKAGKVIWEGEI